MIFFTNVGQNTDEFFTTVGQNTDEFYDKQILLTMVCVLLSWFGLKSRNFDYYI